jgi:hypothetical protein
VSVERICTGSFSVRTGVNTLKYFSVAIFSKGPYRGILELKSKNKPYTLQRFHIYGKLVVEAVNPPPAFGYIDWAGVLYLGKKGNEVLLKKQMCGGSRCEIDVDSYLDIATEFRGLGIQVIRIEGFTGWWFDVDIYTDSRGICFELTWVGQ